MHTYPSKLASALVAARALQCMAMMKPFKAVISVIAKLHFIKIYIYPTFQESFNILCSVLLVSLQERKVNLNCTGQHKHTVLRQAFGLSAHLTKWSCIYSKSFIQVGECEFQLSTVEADDVKCDLKINFRYSSPWQISISLRSPNSSPYVPLLTQCTIFVSPIFY